MKVYLTGVAPDGVTPDPNFRLAGNTAQPLALPRGATMEIAITVVDPFGAFVDLAGDTLVLTVRKASTQLDPQPGLTKTVAVGAGSHVNTATFPAITPTDTRFLESGRWVFDVWRVRASGARDQVVALSAFVLGPALLAP